MPNNWPPPYIVLDPQPRGRLARLINDALDLDALGFSVWHVQGFLDIAQTEAIRRRQAREQAQEQQA